MRRDKEEVSGYGARKMAGSITSCESHIISASKVFRVLLVKVLWAPDIYGTGRTGQREASAHEPEGLMKILRVFGQSLAMALKFSSTLHSLLRAANTWLPYKPNSLPLHRYWLPLPPVVLQYFIFSFSCLISSHYSSPGNFLNQLSAKVTHDIHISVISSPDMFSCQFK